MSSLLKTEIFPQQIHSILPSDAPSLNSLKLLALLVEETSDILNAADIDFKPVTWNRASERIYGLKAEQVIGRDIREFININYTNYTREEVRAIINGQGEWRGEASFIRPTDKKTVTLLMCFKQLKENNNLVGYLVSATDISDRKEAESRLTESEKRFRDMADAAPAMIWLSDENDITTYTNKKWIDYVGKNICNDPEGWSSLIHPQDRAQAVKAYHKGVQLKKQITLVYRLRRADGIYRWVHDTCVPRFLSSGQFIGYSGSVVDIEDEKRKHEQLLYQATILENVSEIIVTTDLDFRVKSWNKIAEEHYGITEGDALGRSMDQLVNFTFYGTTSEEAVKDLHKNGYWNGEVSFLDKKGERKYFLHTVKFVFNGAGEKIGFQ